MKNPIIIAIDGHSSTGKSTVAKLIAGRLGYIYIDTGAIYRALSLQAMRDSLVDGAGRVDVEGLRRALSRAAADGSYQITFRTGAEGKSETYLNGENVEGRIRSMEVSAVVSHVAALPFVREYVDGILHRIGAARGVVMDGRDIGTAVFPDSELKIFMTADAVVRAKRRYDELVAGGQNADFDRVLANVRERDYLDEHREVAPLVKAPDALVLDNSEMSVAEELEWIMEKVNALER